MGKSKMVENKRADNFIKGFAAVTIALAVLAIMGWMTNKLVFASFNSAYIPMALSTATIFLLFSLTVIVYNYYNTLAKTFIILNIAGIALSALLLILSLLEIRLEVEHLWLATSHDENRFILGHISPVTAVCLVLIGSAVLLIHFSFTRKTLLVLGLILSVLSVLIGFILILLYLFGVPLFYGGAFIPPALTTSLSLTFLSLACSTVFGTRIWSHNDHSDVFDKRTFFTVASIYLGLTIGLIVAGYSYYKNYESNHRNEVDRMLLSISDLKISEISHWRTERFGDAALFFKNPNFSSLVNILVQNENDRDARNKIQIWLNHIIEGYPYNFVCLHNSKGKELLKSPVVPANHSLTFQKHLQETAKSGEIDFLDFHRNEIKDRTLLRVAIPIFDNTNKKQVIAFLALRIDPKEYLYPLIERWPVPSNSAETLLLRREGNEIVYLNELRFNKDSVLTVRKPLTATQIPAVKAALGETGIVEGLDYRGVEVIACIGPIPNSPWFMVARIDREEVYLPIKQRFLTIAISVALLILSSGVGFGYYYRKQKIQYYKERSKGTEQIRKLNRVYAVLSNINQAIVRIHDRETLFNEVAKIAVRDGGFVIAWVGLFNEDCTKIIPHSYSGDEASCLSIRDSLLGQDNSATCVNLIESDFVICNDINSECLNVSWHEEIIKAKCKSFVFLNLIVENQKIGVIALYADTIHFFDEMEIKLLYELSLDVSFAIEFIEKEEGRKLAERQLNELNTELEDRIKDRTRLLEISNKELESFAYSVSHDLRAPLRAINGFSKFLEEDYSEVLSDEGKRHLKIIRDNSQKMDRLITDLLSLSRVARINLNIAAIDIKKLVQNIYDEIIPEELKPLFTFKVGELPDCYGDPTMLKQVWINLISNAIKYTSPREKKIIEISGKIVDDEIVYSIKDSGVGFDANYKHKLFGIFQRLHGEEEFEGTGVGLAIVKRIVERHLGKVWADAELNVGATFSFSIPKKEI